MGIDWDKYNGRKHVDVQRRPMEAIIREQEQKHLATMKGRTKMHGEHCHCVGCEPPDWSKVDLGALLERDERAKALVRQRSLDQNLGLGTTEDPTYTASLGPTKVRIASPEATYAWLRGQWKIDTSPPLSGTIVRFFNAGEDLNGKSFWKRDAKVNGMLGRDILVEFVDNGMRATMFHDWWMSTVFPVSPIIRIMPAEGMPVRFSPFKWSKDVFEGTVGKYVEEDRAYDLKRDCESSVKYQFTPDVWMQEIWPHTERF